MTGRTNQSAVALGMLSALPIVSFNDVQEQCAWALGHTVNASGRPAWPGAVQQPTTIDPPGRILLNMDPRLRA